MTFERSITKTAGLLALSILMTGVAYYCTTVPLPNAQFYGWIGMAFFGFGSIVIAASLFRAGTCVVFDDAGIHDLRTSWGLVAWSEIETIWVGSVQSQRFLCIELHDAAARVAKSSAWQQRICRANNAMGYPAFTLAFVGLTPGFDDALGYLCARHPEKMRDSSPPQFVPNTSTNRA
jgi:hypothetical protein